MGKYARKTTKVSTPDQKTGKRAKPAKQRRSKAIEHIKCLLELHRLQGALLKHLEKEVE